MPTTAPKDLKEVWKQFRKEIRAVMDRIKEELEDRRLDVTTLQTAENAYQIYTWAFVHTGLRKKGNVYAINLEYINESQMHFVFTAEEDGVYFESPSVRFFMDEYDRIAFGLREWAHKDWVETVAANIERHVRGPRGTKEWIPRKGKRR